MKLVCAKRVAPLANAVVALAASLLMATAGEPTNGPLVALGLTNIPIGGSALEIIDNGVLFVHHTDSGDGVSVQLGEADSGIFLYPLTGDLYEGDTMDGKAYGRLNGTNDQFISSIRGVHTGRQSATVTADFSALGATRVKVFVGATLLGQVDSAIASVEIAGNGYDSKGNPWWRMPDGRYGAVVELAGGGKVSLPAGANAVTTQTDYSAQGNCVFLFPEDATNTVEFISRVDVTAFSIGSFCLTDARLGVFHQRHKALGQATLEALTSRLTIANLVSNEDGLLIELPSISTFDMDFVPLALNASNAAIQISGFGTSLGLPGSALGTLAIYNGNGALHIGAEMGIAPENTDITVLSNGVTVSTASIPSSSVVDLFGFPRLAGCQLLSRTLGTRPGFAVRLDSLTSFTLTNGEAFVGNEVRLLAPESARFESIEHVVIRVAEVPSFTITDERVTIAPAPKVEIARSVGGATLVWPDPNRSYFLESATSLSDGFVVGAEEPAFETNHCHITISSADESRFFRLRRRVYTND